MKKLRLIIADDHSMVRQGVKSVIASQPSWKLCGEANNGRRAVELAKKLQPHIAVLDISMPELNGLAAIPELITESPKTKVLILTMHDSESLADEVLEAGAHGYLLKSDAAELLPKAIAALVAGKVFVSPKIKTAAKESSKAHAEDPAQQGQSGSIRFRLTPRERQIVQLLAEGKTNKEVAEMLSISSSTVETHRKNILNKLNLRSTADLVRYAIRNSLIQL